MSTPHKPLHPGFIVKDALMNGVNLSVTESAKRLGVTRTTLSRLCTIFFDTSIEIWMNLQTQYDVWKMMQKKHHFHIKKLDDAA